MNPVRAVSKLFLSAPFLVVTLLLGCAPSMTMQTSQVLVSARSHNRSNVDVYLLCGDRGARWLGVVGPRGGAALDFPYPQARCMQGLNFFLVPRDFKRGYWVGPIHLQAGSRIDLVIEKYAGLSSAYLSRE